MCPFMSKKYTFNYVIEIQSHNLKKKEKTVLDSK